MVWGKGDGWGVSLFKPIASITLSDCMKIWCKIQVLKDYAAKLHLQIFVFKPALYFNVLVQIAGNA